MAVEGRTWNLNLRLSFFTGAAFGNINHPAMLRFPFRTYRSLLVPARCSHRTVGHFPLSIHTDRALRRFLCVLRRPLCRFACGKCRADDCRPLSCAGRVLLYLAGTFMVRIRLGRSGGFGTAEKSDRTDRSRSLVRNAVCREGRSPVRKSECAKAPRGPRVAWSKRGSSVRHRAAPARRRTTCAFRFAFLGS